MDRLKLYLWKSEGGLSIQWEGDIVREPANCGFFIFGRFGSGWKPFGRLNDKARTEAKLAAERAKDRFGLETDIMFGAPHEYR